MSYDDNNRGLVVMIQRNAVTLTNDDIDLGRDSLHGKCSTSLDNSASTSHNVSSCFGLEIFV